jgi:ribonuclease HI
MEEWVSITKWLDRRTKEPKCIRTDIIHISWKQALQLQDRVLMTKATVEQSKVCRTIIYTFKSAINRRETRPSTTTVLLQGTITTDGSWKTQASVFGNKPIQAAAGIIQLDPTNISQPTKAIRINGFATSSTARVFAQETIAVALALAGGATTIYTDSKSVCNQANALKKTGNRTLDLVQRSSSCVVKHIRAHAERRKLQTAWTPEEWGNHLADRVADGDPHYQATDMDAKEVSQILMEHSGRWTVWHNQQLFFNSFKHCRASLELHNYLQSKRSRDYPDVRWIPHLYSFGQSCYGTTLRQRGATAKLALFKFDRDRIFGEGSLDPCICGCGNTLEHWISSCTRTDMINIRTQALERISEITGHDSLFKPTLEACLANPLGHMIWRGVWQPAQVELVEAFHNQQSAERKRKLAKEIKDLTSILMQASLSLYSTASGKKLFVPVTKASSRKRKRKEQEEAIFRLDHRQRSIAEWFNLKHSRKKAVTQSGHKRKKDYALLSRTSKILDFFSKANSAQD